MPEVAGRLIAIVERQLQQLEVQDRFLAQLAAGLRPNRRELLRCRASIAESKAKGEALLASLRHVNES